MWREDINSKYFTRKLCGNSCYSTFKTFAVLHQNVLNIKEFLKKTEFFFVSNHCKINIAAEIPVLLYYVNMTLC